MERLSENVRGLHPHHIVVMQVSKWYTEGASPELRSQLVAGVALDGLAPRHRSAYQSPTSRWLLHFHIYTTTIETSTWTTLARTSGFPACSASPASSCHLYFDRPCEEWLHGSGRACCVGVPARSAAGLRGASMISSLVRGKLGDKKSQSTEQSLPACYEAVLQNGTVLLWQAGCLLQGRIANFFNAVP